MGTRRVPVLSETWSEELRLQAFPVNSWAWLVRIQGPVDASNVELLEGALEQVLARGVSRIAIDLGDVPHMSSAAYGCLLVAADRVRRNGGLLVVARASVAIREVFHLLGISESVSFVDDFIAARVRLGRKG